MGASSASASGARFVAVHGHFYQPPRENPWLGAVEREENAAPYHDWNERITDECYGPFTAADLWDKISFNIGPTLMQWLERTHLVLHDRIVAADARSARSDGLGNAIAQPFYHAILPLAPRRDKETLIRWGIADFTARFSRKPLGLWLPEAAVDDETLDVAAAEGVEFVILDSRQADAPSVDTTRPYHWFSPLCEGRGLAVFFYHEALSQGVVSGTITRNADAFAQTVGEAFRDEDRPQLAVIASDGEFFGHHRRDAIAALSGGLVRLENSGVAPRNFARALRERPPEETVRILPLTSWSCPHGIGRWREDCGCRHPSPPEWNQAWRGPLRNALDRLAQRLDAVYEDEAAVYFEDPWALRDAVVPGRLGSNRDDDLRVLSEKAKRPLRADEAVRALRLLEMQRERLAMFTSCGWFFDDPSGIETIAILQRAARAIDLARLLGDDPEESFLERLRAARSNLASQGTAADIYRRSARAARVDLDRIAAHTAILDHLEIGPADLPKVWRTDVGPAVRVEKKGLAGRDLWLSVRPIHVSRADTQEHAQWHAIVRRADRLDIACWLAPKTADFAVAELGREFLTQDDAAFLAAMDSRFGSARFGLDGVLSDERSDIRKAFASEASLGADRFLYLGRWTRAIAAARRGSRDDDALLDLLMAAREHGFRAADLPWAHRLSKELQLRLEEALSTGGADAVSRALKWLDAMDLAEMKIDNWRLLDFWRRWNEKLSSLGPSIEKDACRALGERLGLVETALENA